MCQSVAEGGRRCPAHRHDTRAVISALQAKEGGYGASVYHNAFVDLRRAHRGVSLTEEEARRLDSEIHATVIALGQDPATDTHNADSATVLSQKALLTQGLITQEADDYVCSAVNAETREDSRRIFSYLYDNVDQEAHQPTATEKFWVVDSLMLSDAQRLANDDKFVRTLALLKSGHYKTADPDYAVAVAPVDLPRITQLTNVMSRHSPVAAVGYDPETAFNSSRLEVILRDDLDTRLAYQNVSESQYAAICNGGVAAAATIQEIRLDPACRYASAEAAEIGGLTENLSSQQDHCEHCGQFVGGTPHSCPAMRLDPEIYTAARVHAPEPEHGEVAIEDSVAAAVAPARENDSNEEQATSSESASYGSLPQTPAEQVYPSPSTLLQGLTYEQRTPSEGSQGYLYEGSIRRIQNETIDKLVDLGVFDSREEALSSNSNLIYTHGPDGQTIQHVSSPSTGEVAFTRGTSYYVRSRGQELAAGETWGSHYGSIPEDAQAVTQNQTYSTDIAPVATGAIMRATMDDERQTLVAHSVNRGEGDRWKFGRTRDVKRLLEAGETVSVPFTHQYAQGWSSRRHNFVDAQGWEVDTQNLYSRGVTATGTVALRKNANGVVEVVGVESLHCSACSNSNCTHLGYSLRQTPYIAQSIINPADASGSPRVARRTPNPETGLPISLESHCVVSRNEAGQRTITFRAPSSRNIDYRQQRQRLLTTNLPVEDGGRELFILETSVPNATHITRAVRNLSEGEGVVVPIITSFQPLNYGSSTVAELNWARVRGTLTYGRDEEGNPVVRDRNLRCNCEVYQRNYSCRHTRRVQAGEMTIIANPREQEAISAMAGEPEIRTYRQAESMATAAAVQDREAIAGRTITFEEAETMAIREREEYERGYEERERNRRAERDRRQAERDEQERRAELEALAGYSAQRAKMAEVYANPTGTNYAEDFHAFEDKVAEIKARIAAGEDALSFRTTNVLNGIGDPTDHARKFGVELEVVFPNGDGYTQREKIARALQAEGLSDQSYVSGYHSGQENGWSKWTAEEDCTVDLEVVSPLMSDTPEDWAQLQRVCDIIKEHGGAVNTQTGSHVHISTGDYGSGVAPHAALVQRVARNADILYRLGSNPETKTHRGTTWCRPNVFDPGQEVTRSGMSQSWGGVSGYLNAPHESAVNLEASGDGRKSHAEVRIWDGSLNPAHIQMQVMLTAALAEKAAQETNPANMDRFTFASSEEPSHSLGTGRSTTWASEEEETRGFRQFLTETLPRQEDRDTAIAAWVTSKWQGNARSSRW